MASLAQRPAVQTWLEPKVVSRPRVPTSLTRPKAAEQTKSIGLFEQIVAIAAAIPAAVISCAIQFLLYAGSILLFPFLPFLTPLFAAPVVLLLSFSVLAFGAVLTAIGWL
jgi:uncharacterized membrane protein (DUF485 family)